MEDISGRRYGMLTVLGFSHISGERSRHYHWDCQCDCGKFSKVDGGNLKNGNSASCGCERERRFRKSRLKHGHTSGGASSVEFSAWSGMKQRCNDPNHKSFAHYGGRGISVCARWSDFSNFLADMGPRPSPQHSVDRKDVNGNYSPENCMWATRSQQARNRRDQVNVLIDGSSVSLADYCEEKVLPYNTIWQRIKKLGWSPDRALSTPIRRMKRAG